MGHAVPGGRGFAVPHLSIRWRRRHAEVISFRAKIEEAEPESEPEHFPGAERFYDLGCRPPVRRRDTG